METFAQTPSCGNFRLGFVASDLLCVAFHMEPFVWFLSLGNFRVEPIVSRPSSERFRMDISNSRVSLGKLRLTLLGWELSPETSA